MDENLVRSIDRLTLSEHARLLREMYFNSEPGIGGERARLSMEAWKETEGEPMLPRRAKLLKKVLEGVPVVIHPGQLLVGSDTRYFRGAYPQLDQQSRLLEPLIREKHHLPLGGPVEKASVSQEDWQSIMEAAKFWKGQTSVDREDEAIQALVGSWEEDCIEAGSKFYSVGGWNRGVIGAEKLLTGGLRAYIREAEEGIRQFFENRDDDLEKLYFYQAAVIVLKAVISYARRYAQLAGHMAAKEGEPARRRELDEITKVCEWVPENPARTFHEALQSYAFISTAIKLENCVSPGGGHGLVDQLYYPYFKRDLEENRLTLEKTADLVSDFLLTFARFEFIVESTSQLYQQNTGCLSSIGLGGLTRDGQDASNELTYLFLHVMGLVRYAEPHLVIRWHKDTPRWLMCKAMDTAAKAGGGVPQFQNSDHIVDYLLARGISLEDARDWKSSGCSQVTPADTLYYGHPTYINVPLCLDLALHNGIASATGKRLGPETGDSRHFESFEQVYDAFKRQYEFICKRQLWLDRVKDRLRAEYFQQPLLSALNPACMRKGKLIEKGGLPNYATWYKKDRGIIPTADSLTAIKKLVFEAKKLTMGELIDALDGNFEGERGEEIRQMCVSAPKYGNDTDEADKMVCDVAKFTGSVILGEKNIFGYPFAINRNGQGWHLMAGKKLAALPNGRKRGEPLADGSLSPTQGVDTRGPTAVLNSALKADFGGESLAGIMTLSMPAMLMRSGGIREKVVDLTETFLRRGGTYIQYNVVDRNTLLEAKKHPEKYRDLLVRVGGYSAYFVFLSPEIQDEIIRRTEQDLGSLQRR